jgi:hypothetical protein
LIIEVVEHGALLGALLAIDVTRERRYGRV